MGRDILPEDVLKALEKGTLAPYYLFYGPGQFRLEKVLDRIRRELIPDAAKDFNQEICYGGESDPGEIANRARSLPFLAENRLIIVRRTENFKSKQLEIFLPYLADPSGSTCLIFLSSKTDFRIKFYQKIRAKGSAVYFGTLQDGRVIPWIKRAAKELNLNISAEACAYLQQIVGNRARDLHVELEKLLLRYGDGLVGLSEVQEMAIHSRVFTIFELTNAISSRNGPRSLVILNRFLEEEDKRRAPLQVVGMLNRQLRLLWQTKGILSKGGGGKELGKKLGSAAFAAKDLIRQSRLWSMEDLEQGLGLLYQADGRLKTGWRPHPVLESLVLSLCRADALPART